MAAYRRRFMGSVVAVGLVAGLGAAALFVALDATSAATLGSLAHYVPLSPGHEPPLFHWGSAGQLVRWLLILLPFVGGLASGLVTFTWAPEVEGHGTDAAIEAYHFKDGRVRRRVPLIKSLTSALTIGFGGSGGREGPIAQIGSGFGSMLADWLSMPTEMRRALLATGMAAGIGAIFHAPMAGAIFAAEVMYRGPFIEHVVLFPGFIACVVAYCVFGAIFGYEPLFATPAYGFDHPQLLLPLSLLAVVTALGAIVYVRAFYGVHHFAFGLRIPHHVKPAIGGLLTGLTGYFFPEALGSGYGVLQACFNGDRGVGATVTSLPTYARLQSWIGGATAAPSTLLAAGTLGIVALAKIVTTSMSIGTGGSGGVFGPAVVIGGALGGATGHATRLLFPRLPIEPGAFALIGMASFFAGAANTPISTIIMVSEMTGNYGLIVPAMFTCIASYAICRSHTLYEQQLDSPYVAPANLKEMTQSILTAVSAARALADAGATPPPTIDAQAKVGALRTLIAEHAASFVVTLDSHGYPSGLISTDAVERSEDDDATALAESQLIHEVPLVTSDDSLRVVVNTLAHQQLPGLLIVDKDEFSRVLGVLRPEDIVTAYRKWSMGPDEV